VLSGAAVKAGVIGLIRFLPLNVPTPDWGQALVVAGLFSAFYGVAIGITQRNAKTVLAYSSVSQMGVIATVLGMVLAVGDGDAALSVGFYAAHHTLVKGALFLAVGVAQMTGGRRLWLLVLLPAAILSLGLGGFPLTGGALAKLVVKAPAGDGIVGTLMGLSSAGTTLLMIHFLCRLAVSSASRATAAAPTRLALPWLVMALAGVVVPWVIYLRAMDGSIADSIAGATLWSAFWPCLVGGVLAIGLWRNGSRLPRVPDGDIARVVVAGATHFARAVGFALGRLDEVLRQWPVAGVALMGLAVMLTVLMLIGQ
jgi:formate hydrogenlyase subunit 3/multisubunit Na+/H+ antiporter MnhD subunit